jgi:hypothetical protein
MPLFQVRDYGADERDIRVNLSFTSNLIFSWSYMVISSLDPHE